MNVNPFPIEKSIGVRCSNDDSFSSNNNSNITGAHSMRVSIDEVTGGIRADNPDIGPTNNRDPPTTSLGTTTNTMEDCTTTSTQQQPRATRADPPVGNAARSATGIPVPMAHGGVFTSNNIPRISHNHLISEDPLQHQQDVLVEARYIHDASTAMTPNAVATPDIFVATMTSNNNMTNSNTNGKCNRTHILLGALVIIAAAGVASFVVCGSNGCFKSSGSIKMQDTSTNPPVQAIQMATQVPVAQFPPIPTNVPPVTLLPPSSMTGVTEAVPPTVMATTMQPALPPTLSQGRTEQIVSFINSITLSGRTIASPAEVESGAKNYPSERALSWIINDDPLQLVPDTPSNKFQLMQRYALRTIIVQQPVPNEWSNTSTWSLSECQWYGVECSTLKLGNDIGEQQSVTKIELGSTSKTFVDINGILPADIGLLSSLLYIDMYNCSLRGSLPASIGNWQNVSHVDLSYNKLTGSLPSFIGDWQNVSHMDLSYNRLTGSLPGTVGDWYNVTYVSFSFNQLTGSLPTSIGNWQSVTSVYLGVNQLTGPLPTTIGNWQSVDTVDLHFNTLTGSVPSSIGNWQSVTSVGLAGNQLNASLPISIGNWQNVTFVNLADNQLIGSLPNSIGNWHNMTFIDLSGNYLIGSLPSTIGNWQNVTYVNLATNQLNGSLPNTVGNWQNVAYVDLSSNQLTGSLPTSIGTNWTSLEYAYLYNNDFTGTVPMNWCQLTSFENLWADCYFDVICSCCTYCY